MTQETLIGQKTELGVRAPENTETGIHTTLIEELRARSEGSMGEVPEEAITSFDAWEVWLDGFRA